MFDRRARRLWSTVVACSLLATSAVAAAWAQPATLVTDLNVTVRKPAQPNDVRDFEALGGVLFFAINDGNHGSELWRSDGTTAGTRLVKDVCPGVCASGPAGLTVSNGRLFFTADDGAHGRELWQTDGTAAGTTLVADVYPDLEDGIRSSRMMDAGGVLFFLADDGAHGEEPWRTDGTAAGTRLIKDVNPGPVGSAPALIAVSGGRVLLAAFDGLHGVEPWVSDGTAAGTVLLGDLNPGVGYSSLDGTPRALGWPAAPAPQGGFLFAAEDGVTGVELWLSDGTPAGTSMLKDIGTAGGSQPTGLTPFQGAVYFAAEDAAGIELWKTNGTTAGTVRVKDIWPGSRYSSPQELTVAGNRLFFYASDGVHGVELWASDGTAAGTALVTDLNPGPSDAFFPAAPRHGLSALGNSLFFLASDALGLRAWKSDGTAAGTVPLSPAGLSYQTLSVRDSALATGGRFYFLTGDTVQDLWASNGTAAGTGRVRDFVAGTPAFLMIDGRSWFPGSFAALGDILLFQGDDGTGYELWRSDGTPGGTSPFARLGQPPLGSFPFEIQPRGAKAWFLANADGAVRLWSSDGTPGQTQALSPPSLRSVTRPVQLGPASYFFGSADILFGADLWKTDGTPAGTVQVAPLSDQVREATVSGGKLFFSGYGLWVSDGTATGTVPIESADPAARIDSLTDAGGTLFFRYQLDGRPVLWKSDGTGAGTGLVKDIRVGSSGGQHLRELAAPAGGPLFFAGDDGATGLELWKSDGTAAGTVRIADIHPGPRGSGPRWLTPVGAKVYFVADDGVHGRELWVSDGTAAGTRLVADVAPGAGSSLPAGLAAVGSTLLFSAFDGVHGVEPWRTGGSSVGTRRIQDIAPGTLSSSPLEFTAAGPNVYFAANDNATGFELWKVPKSAVLSTFADVPTTYWAWPYVEALAGGGLTSGCAEGLYCPAQTVTRADLSVFLTRGLHGAGFVPPPATGTRFQDVPVSYWAAPWIEQFTADGFTSGCSVTPPLFCPDSAVPRSQMAVFLLRARHGASYVPPPATGTLFQDVPASYWAAPWIERLAAEGITGGCAPNRFCPDDPVARDQMAVFLTRTFNLPLP